MAPSFPNVIFAGGGSRCFWQLGFWQGARSGGLDLGSELRFVGSVSAGCAMATAAVLDRADEALALFVEMAARNPGNVHWRNLGPGRDGPLLPHAGMYRSAVREFVRPEDLAAFRRVSLAFLMASHPRWIGGIGSVALGLSLYNLEKTLRKPVHPSWPVRLGFRPVVGFAHECRDPEEFTDLVLASSCVPPVLPGGRYRAQPVLDGGLIDSAPALLAEDQPGETLVLLTRRSERPLPSIPSRTYVQPSRPIPIGKFDYANPAGLQAAWDLGVEDGQRFAAGAATARAAVPRATPGARP